VDNPMKSKKIRKVSKKMQITLIVLSSLLLIFGSFLLIRNFMKNRDSKNSKTQEEKINTKKEIDYYTLISSLNISSLPSEYFGYFFTKDSYSGNDISHPIKIYMAIRKIMAEDLEKYKDPGRTLTISEKEVEQALKELFGEAVEFKHTSLVGNSCSYSAFKYDKNQKNYIQKPGECEDEKTMSILMEQENSINTEETKEFTVWVAFVDFSFDRNSNQMKYQYYKDASKELVLGESEKYDLEPWKSVVDRYHFIFKKQGNHYIFDKVERIQ